VTLDEFISSRVDNLKVFPRNAYVTHPRWKHIYVRVNPRMIDGVMQPMVIDLANIEAKKPGSGAFRALVTHLQETYPKVPIYVEQVQTDSFAAILLHMGFKQRENGEPSFYLMPS
jgi:hypothetical protein